MKTKLTLIAFVSFSIILKAQTTSTTNVLTGTAPTPNEFLGSSNNFDVIFKANGGTEKMRLTTTGNFGIGTGTMIPELRAHFLGATGFPATSGNVQTGVLRLQGTGSNGVMDFSVNAGQAACIQVTNRTNLSLNYVLALNPNGGNVGIGTKTPSDKLEVKGGYIKVMGGGVYAADGYGSTFYGLSLTRSGLVGLPDISGDGTNPLIIAGKGDGTGVTIISGNVGIGTSVSYMNTNTEQYKLAVNGKIGAKAIKVEISSGWADYVFDKNYKLKTIQELEAFIKKNQHLPNVPSACEVENNGIDIATMDATLLAKIEELSLYIIELSKKIEVLEQMNTGK